MESNNINTSLGEGIKLGKYRHFKGGEYEVIGIAKHSETEEEFVVYKPLYKESGLWIRPKAMFFEIVEKDGKPPHLMKRGEFLRIALH